MKIESIVGENIHRLRTEKGLSQLELSFLSGINKNYISDLERGTRNPTISVLKRIADALETPITALFSEEL